MKPIINFRNDVQVTLWKKELCGQISDGYWENSRPHNHYQEITSADVQVGTPLGPVGFHTKRAYNLAAKDLFDCVGDDMLEYIHGMKGYEKFTVKELKRELKDMTTILNAPYRAARDYFKR